MYDLLIKNGTVIDGSNTPMFRADVGVKEDTITDIGDLSGETAERVVDASGHYVTPGFIDVNNHSDTYWEMFRTPGAESLLLQGITTIIGGNSGASLAPLIRPSDIRAIRKWTDIESISFNWLSMREFLDEVERRPLSVNFATLAGHGTIRRSVLESPTKEPGRADLARMRKLFETALREGAIGLSTGLKYTHARRAEHDEIAMFLSALARERLVYATYLRDEGEHLLDATLEAIAISREIGVSLHISHLKAVGKRNWHLMEEALETIKNASMDGLDISFDVYPYTASGSVLYTFLPEWVTESGRETMLHRIRDFKVRQAVMRDMRANEYDYSSMRISVSQLNNMMGKQSVGELAAAQGTSPEETVLDILSASGGRAIVSVEVSSERNVEKAVQNPFSVISSNGVGYSREYEKTGNMVHPRNFGAFPRVFARYVRGKGLLSFEEAVHKMTGKPASKFGLSGRGFLRSGSRADIVVFDPEHIADRSTMNSPYRYPEGIRAVIVNGEVAAEEGKYLGTRSGEVVRHRKKSWFPFR